MLFEVMYIKVDFGNLYTDSRLILSLEIFFDGDLLE